MSRLDYVYGSVTVQERLHWPRLVFSVTQRTLRNVGSRSADKNVKCLVCFCCVQKRTTLVGFEYVDFSGDHAEVRLMREIDYWSPEDFAKVEFAHTTTSLNNCSFKLWEARYAKTRKAMLKDLRSDSPSKYSMPKDDNYQKDENDPLDVPCLSIALYHVSQSAVSRQLATPSEFSTKRQG